MTVDTSRPDRRPFLIAVLLAAATVFFVWGAFAERSSHHDESKSPTATAEPAGNGETSEDQAAEPRHPKGESAEPDAGGEYRPFGIDLESTPLVLGGAVISLALAAFVALVALRHRTVLLAFVVLALGFTALEIAEVVHQADANKPGLLTLALIAGVLHAAAALLAVGVLVPALHPRSKPEY